MNTHLLAEARRMRLTFMATIALSVAGGICLIAQAFALSRIIRQVFLDHAALEEVSGLLLIVGLLVTLRALLGWGAHRTASEVAIRVKADLRKRLLVHLAALGPTYLLGERTGELVTTATTGIDALDPFFRDYLPALFNALLIPLAILLVVFPLDALTFIILLITAPLIPAFMMLIGMAAGALARQQYARLSHLSAHFLDVTQGLATLKLFNRSRYQITTIAHISDDFRSATMRVLRVAFVSAFALEMLATLSVAIVAVEIGLRLLHGGIPFEQALFLLVIAPEFYQPLRTLGAKFHAGTEASAAAERLFAVLAMPLPPRPARAVPIPDRLHLRFENVTYRYPDSARPAVENLSFEIRPGEHVALVGESGSGKSTTAALLLRFLAPDSGQITVSGVDLAQAIADQWRTRIAWVSQSPHLFQTTIADNIRLGRPDAPLEDIMEAARLAEAHEFIQALPQGYDTPCGERGLRLSGGQAQRIAIARAFLTDAPLLVLDEMTAFLDPQTEAAVQSGLRRLLQGRTALVITHRLHTIMQMDRIIVLHAGRVVEEGTHSQLMNQAGRYRALVEVFDPVTHAG